MRHIQSEFMGGHALLFDGPLELVQAARDANKGMNPFKQLDGISWPGRYCEPGNWHKAAGFLAQPWPQAVANARTVVDGIKKSRELILPKSVRRKGRWGADDGEVDADRAMHGDPDFYRETRRIRTAAPPHIAFITNLDCTKSGFTNSSGVFFRSYLVMALADILEDAGYSVEIWSWTRGLNVYPAPFPEQFLACKIKHAGDMADFDALSDALSDWFTTQAVFGAMAAGPVKPVGKGLGCYADEKATTVEDTGIGEWADLLDIQQGIQVFPIPMVWGSLSSAVEAAKGVLDRITASE